MMMSQGAVYLLCLLSALPMLVLPWQLEESPREVDHQVDLPTRRPLIIAHRGSSGMLPEHTVQAYKLAIDQGADIIECDVAVTKDCKLVCFHDNWMKEGTNVAAAFPDRLRTYYVPDINQNITDYFTVDFTLDELRTLRVYQRFSFRDQRFNGLYQIATFKEYLQVAQAAGRPVGIYPETKQPMWVNSLPFMTEANVTFEQLLVDTLQTYGYNDSRQPCFLQSFSQQSLDALKNLTDLKLVYLMSTADGIPTDADLQLWADKSYYGLGLNKRLIVQVGDDNNIVNVTDFIQRAHRYGLKVHPYTFRNEDRYLAWDYGQDIYMEMKQFYDLEVDGYFTDFTLTCANFLNVIYSQSSVSNGCRSQYATTCMWIAIMTGLLYGLLIKGKFIQ